MQPIRPAVSRIILLGGLGTFISATAFVAVRPANAQSALNFQAGYDSSGANPGWRPTVFADGTTSETTPYSFLDAGSSLPATNTTYSTTSSLYQSISTGTGGFNGRNFTENSVTSGATPPIRIAQAGFYLPAGETVKLSSITFYGYVRFDPLQAGQPAGSTNYVNPFTAGHFAVFNGPPNSGASVVSGDSTFTTNYLTSTPVFAGYREAANGSTDTSRPIMALTLNLSSTAVLTGGQSYFFATSFNVDHTIIGTNGSTLGDAFSVIATQTDDTYGQPNTPAGDGKTNGGAEVYSNSQGNGSSWQTDTPDNNNVTLLDAFPFLLNGSISVMPEPSVFALIAGAGPLLAGGVLYRRRNRKTA